MMSFINLLIVDMAIGLDALKPYITPPEKFAEMFQKKIEDFVKLDKYNINKCEPPSYTIEEMIEQWHKGLLYSLYYI